jgi:hypothetical protein
LAPRLEIPARDGAASHQNAQPDQAIAHDHDDGKTVSRANVGELPASTRLIDQRHFDNGDRQ